MKIILIVVCVAVVLWIIILNIDARLFDGRFLVKRMQSPEDFVRILDGILENETKPIENWPVEYSDWLSDKMYIPIKNEFLEKYRESIVATVEQNSTKDVLNPAAKQLLRDISNEIKTLDNPKAFIEAIQKDIQKHNSGDFKNLGEDFSKFNALLRKDSPLRGLPFKFWDAWLEESVHDFPGGYKGIGKNDWPELASLVVNSLMAQTPIIDNPQLKQFDGPKK